MLRGHSQFGALKGQTLQGTCFTYQMWDDSLERRFGDLKAAFVRG